MSRISHTLQAAVPRDWCVLSLHTITHIAIFFSVSWTDLCLDLTLKVSNVSGNIHLTLYAITKCTISSAIA